MPAAESTTAGASRSQTLSRGIAALELLSDSPAPLLIQELADGLGVHRSVAYRILRTLEEHGLAVRDASGRIRLGAGLAALARGVSRDLQQLALPELSAIAEAFDVTAFLAVLDRREVITLQSVEPSSAHASIAQRPGTRHGIERGAPGAAVLLAMNEGERESLRRAGVPVDGERLERARELGYATSRDEVIPGLRSIAVPLRVPGDPQPATLAIVTIRELPDPGEVAAAMRAAAARVAASAS